MSLRQEGVELLEIARNAQRLFAEQEAKEKRRLLGFLVSNCSWRDGALTADLRQPFDLLQKTLAPARTKKATEPIAIAGSLPKVSYMTLMDRLMILSFVLIALSVLQSMTSTKMRRKDSEGAYRMDRRCRWIFPVAYVAGILAMGLIYSE